MPPKIRTQSFLANLPLFKELAPAEIDRLAAGTTELFVPRGEIVFQRGDPCVGFHAVVYGQVKLSFVTPQGGEKVVEIISPGFTFGEALMFMDKPYIVMAQALSDTLLLHVAKEAVFHGIEHDPGFARRMLAGLSRRVHALMADVESYSLQSGTQRVIGYLLRQEAEGGEGGEGQASYTVRLPTSKSIVASRLNLTPEHFSRILHELVDRGLVAVEGRDVRIVDAQKLRDYTG
jgi:CRP-like cAMP-binding protein